MKVEVINRLNSPPASMSVYTESLFSAYSAFDESSEVKIRGVDFTAFKILWRTMTSWTQIMSSAPAISHVADQTLCMFFNPHATFNIITVHDLHAYEWRELKGKGNLSTVFWAFFLKKYDLIVCPSDSTAEKVKALILNATPVVTVPNYMVLEPPLEQSSGKYDVLLVGSGWYKNHAIQCGAICELSMQERLSVVWLNHGDEPSVDALHNGKIDLTTVSGLTSDEVARLYGQCRVLLFCSLSEGFGYPIIEGLNAGMSIVTTEAVAKNFPGLASLAGVHVVPTNSRESDIADATKAALKTRGSDSQRRLFLEKYSFANFCKNLRAATDGIG